MGKPREPQCACPRHDAYDCWRARYKTFQSADEVMMDGGPCDCACHEDDEDTDDWTYEDGVLQR